jgi:hypothetical protein
MIVYPLVRPRGHPFVPTCRSAQRRAQPQSRMPLAAPAKPARSVLDSGEHGATLWRTDDITSEPLVDKR